MTLRGLAKKIYYLTIRSYLPRKIGVYRGVPARRPRLFDASDVDRTYEKELLDDVESHVKSGDECVLVGAGFGVSSVVTAAVVGNSGSLVAYEASDERYECAKETIKINDCSDYVELRRAIVGSDIAVKGDATGVETISEGDLPRCDVMILDCEGAEKDIIAGLVDVPDRIIVETHGCFNSPTEEVVGNLEELGMDIVSITEDNPMYGIDIVTAKKDV